MRCCSFMADALNVDAILPPQCPSPMVKNLNWGYLVDGLRLLGYNNDVLSSGWEIGEGGALLLIQDSLCHIGFTGNRVSLGCVRVYFL